MNDMKELTLDRSKVGTRPGMTAGQSGGKSARADSPFDWEQLVRRCMGRIELAERLLNSFESRFPEDLSKIEEALLENDSAGLPRLVHQLKGAAANVSAPDLHSILARMEEAVRSAQRDIADECIDEIHVTWDRYVQSKSSVEKQ
jgi:HPt (histidine-containing phosphotransfer) domain-containing protein